jgi:hypothetical protein
MKRLLTLVLFAAFCSPVVAQEGARIGVKAAYNSTWLFNKNISDKNSSMDYASSFGTSFGVQYVNMFTPNYGISAEFLISSHTQEYDGDLGGGTTYTLEDNLTYIDIPILFRVGSEKGPYFEIGPQISLLSGTKESVGTSGGSSSRLPDNYTDKEFNDDFNSFGVGAVLGFGVDIKLTDSWRLSPGLRFGYQFTDATTEYTQAEADQLDDADKLSVNADANHNVGSELFGSNSSFGYEKSNRAFGGLHIALSYTF